MSTELRERELEQCITCGRVMRNDDCCVVDLGAPKDSAISEDDDRSVEFCTACVKELDLKEHLVRDGSYDEPGQFQLVAGQGGDFFRKVRKGVFDRFLIEMECLDVKSRIERKDQPTKGKEEVEEGEVVVEDEDGSSGSSKSEDEDEDGKARGAKRARKE